MARLHAPRRHGILAACLLAACGGSGEAPQAVPAQPCGAGPCVSTLAGSGEFGNLDGRGEAAQFTMPHAIAVDAGADLHVADFGNNNLTRIISGDVVSTPEQDTIDFPHPANVATDAAGNRYVADFYGNRILKVSPAGDTSVLAGTGHAGDQDGDAASASFSLPAGLAFAGGVLYVADMGNRKIRRITFPAGTGG